MPPDAPDVLDDHRFRHRYPDIVLEIVARMDLVNLTRREADVALRGRRPSQGDFVGSGRGEGACA